MYRGYLFILLAAAFWGLIGIFSSIAFSQGMEPLEVGFWRASIAWIFFALQAIKNKDTYLDRKDIPLLLIFGVFGISLFYISYLIAVQTGGAAFASVLLYTAPAWVIFVALFYYKEKLTPVKLAAVILVISGVFLISGMGGENSNQSISIVAIIAGLVAGFCYSLYYTIGKYFSTKYSSANLFLYVLPIGAFGILPFVDFAHKTPLAWAALISVAVISTYFANFCYYHGLKYLEAGKASIVATLEPVVAAITAYIFFGEYFSVVGYLGAGLIVTAVITTIYKKQIVVTIQLRFRSS